MAIICHCEAVRDRAIVRAIEHGARSLDQIQAWCGAATRCGGCEPAVVEILEQHVGASPACDTVAVRPRLGIAV